MSRNLINKTPLTEQSSYTSLWFLYSAVGSALCTLGLAAHDKLAVDTGFLLNPAGVADAAYFWYKGRANTNTTNQGSSTGV